MQALIFVVDAADEERFSEARDELQAMLADEQLADALLLVYANKQDMPDARGVEDVADALGLTSLRERTWHIQACSGTTGDGVREGLDWLAAKLAAKH